jgi:hypothetical protein
MYIPLDTLWPDYIYPAVAEYAYLTPIVAVVTLILAVTYMAVAVSTTKEREMLSKKKQDPHEVARGLIIDALEYAELESILTRQEVDGMYLLFADIDSKRKNKHKLGDLFTQALKQRQIWAKDAIKKRLNNGGHKPVKIPGPPPQYEVPTNRLQALRMKFSRS